VRRTPATRRSNRTILTDAPHPRQIRRPGHRACEVTDEGGGSRSVGSASRGTRDRAMRHETPYGAWSLSRDLDELDRRTAVEERREARDAPGARTTDTVTGSRDARWRSLLDHQRTRIPGARSSTTDGPARPTIRFARGTHIHLEGWALAASGRVRRRARQARGEDGCVGRSAATARVAAAGT